MIVGIDIGTQSLKAVVADPDLAVRGEAAVGYTASYPRAGWAEQDPGAWERALAPAIGDALAAAGVPASAVTALGICGQLDGCVPVDAAGAPLGPCLLWSDRRATEYLPALPADELLALTGVVPDATHMAAKIAWLKAHPPDGGRAARYHQPVSYLVARLTGEHVFDEALASTTMLYTLATRGLDDRLLDAFGIARDELPRIANAEDLAGTLTDRGASLAGLPPGIPVAVGTGDDFSSPLGAGIVEPGRVVCTLGTAEVVGALHPEAAVDPDALVETHRFAGGGYFVENPGWFSGGAVAWLAGLLGLEDDAEVADTAAQAPPGAAGLTFLPAMSGAMAPEWIASARGAFYGVGPEHGRPAFARALLEGCAFAMRDVIDRLDGLSVATDTIVLLGGGARSETWAHIRADVSGRPVEVPGRLDTSPLGAALLAAVAAGRFPDVSTAGAAVSAPARRTEPEPDTRAAMDDAYRRYRQLFDCLRPMYGPSP